ncbi:50S ribosomal subunit protein L6 [Erysipelotrichaceae bacterium]|nr:50S ribosomal subunit protein L6 [Erysipelotrichaceae bacterium]
MSRIGNKVLTVNENITVDIQDNNIVVVKGPKGELKQQFSSELDIKLEGTSLTVSRPNDAKQTKMIHGTTTALLNNMLIGVSTGYEIKLEIIGVGYRANLQGTTLNLSLGYSHPVQYIAEEGITIEVPTQTEIIVKGIDKQRVGEVAANIRKHRRPEPYKGKGIRYAGEIVRRKEGKTAGKK